MFIRNQKIKRSLIVFLSSCLLIPLFQNCGPTNFESIRKGENHSEAQSDDHTNGDSSDDTSPDSDAKVTLTWDESSESEVLGYRLNYSVQPGGPYIQSLDVKNVTTFTVENLVPGKTYYFTVKSYSAFEESPPSNEVVVTASGD